MEIKIKHDDGEYTIPVKVEVPSFACTISFTMETLQDLIAAAKAGGMNIELTGPDRRHL